MSPELQDSGDIVSPQSSFSDQVLSFLSLHIWIQQLEAARCGDFQLYSLPKWVFPAQDFQALLSTVAEPIYIATNGVGGFPKNVGLLNKRIDSLPLLNSKGIGPSQNLGDNFNGHFYGIQSRGLSCYYWKIKTSLQKEKNQHIKYLIFSWFPNLLTWLPKYVFQIIMNGIYSVFKFYSWCHF